VLKQQSLTNLFILKNFLLIFIYSLNNYGTAAIDQHLSTIDCQPSIYLYWMW